MQRWRLQKTYFPSVIHQHFTPKHIKTSKNWISFTELNIQWTHFKLFQIGTVISWMSMKTQNLHLYLKTCFLHCEIHFVDDQKVQLSDVKDYINNWVKKYDRKVWTLRGRPPHAKPTHLPILHLTTNLSGWLCCRCVTNLSCLWINYY